MVILVKQWGKDAVSNNEYVAQSTEDLINIPAEFGDRVYIITTGQHQIYGTEGWTEHFAPTIYSAGG